jgi:hypothetical protein
MSKTHGYPQYIYAAGKISFRLDLAVQVSAIKTRKVPSEPVFWASIRPYF